MSEVKKQPLALAHQDEGTGFLRANDRAALFDEQGLGKSKQLIDAVSADVADGKLAGGLIVCPNGLKSNWAEEVAKFSTLPCTVFGSGRTARRMAFRSLKAGFYIVNYEAIDGELPSLRALLRFKRMALILDESHRIKTPEAKTTKAILELRNHAARRYILSGTPVANKPDDLWSQILFLDDGARLGTSFEQFKERYRINGGYRDLSDLRDRIGTLSLRRTKAGSLDLPPKTYKRVEVEMAPVQKSMYETMRTQLELFVRSMEGEEVVRSGEAILARLVRLAQIASNPALLDSGYGETPAKVAELDRLLGELLSNRADQKVIVWTSFIGNIEMLCRRYSRWAPVAIYGDVSNEQRDAAVKAFKTVVSTRLLFANPAAAREGLTLTESNVAIYMDRTFNLTDYLQSQDRIHRISQTQACEIVLLIGRNTVDEFIDFTLDQKHRLARYTQADTDDLRTEDLQLERPEFLRALIGPA